MSTRIASIRLRRTKETTGTFVFTDARKDSPLPALYLKKALFDGDPPDNIVVVIKVPD